MRIRVGINGYGTIGKRIADAVRMMPDMELVGVVKTRPDYSARLAMEMGVRVYTLEGREKLFREKGLDVAGTLRNLLEEIDVVVDATPSGVGASYRSLYMEYNRRNGLKIIFQGGEKPEVAEASFNAYCNPGEVVGKNSVRVVSCNTTGLLRLICTLDRAFGVERVRATIIRRAADPKEDKRGPVNSIKPNPVGIPSHHAVDVKTVIPHIDIETAAVIVPTTLMHVHSVYMVLKKEATLEDVVSVLGEKKRILLIDSEETGIDSTAKIIEVARDAGRKRYDVPELVIWRDSMRVRGREVWLLQAVHQESIVVPENIDAIRGLMGVEGYPEKSISLTDEILGLGKLF